MSRTLANSYRHRLILPQCRLLILINWSAPCSVRRVIISVLHSTVVALFGTKSVYETRYGHVTTCLYPTIRVSRSLQGFLRFSKNIILCGEE